MNKHKEQRITVIINVHNRHRHLARQLDYLGSYYACMMVADSSDRPYSSSVQPHVNYIHYRNWDYTDKLADVIQKVQTPYVHLCADDDFYVPPAVSKCADFMEAQPDYFSAQGRYMAFQWNGEALKYIPLYRNYIDRDVGSDCAAIRYGELFHSYIQCLYSVHRTENLKEAFSLALASDIRNHNLVELLTAVTAVIHGKHRVLPMVYGIREKMSDSAGTFMPNIHEVIRNPAHHNEYDRFVSGISEYAAGRLHMDRSQAQKEFLSGFDPYVANTASSPGEWRRLLPASFRRMLKKAAGLMRTDVNEMAYIYACEGADEALSAIEHYIRKHHITC